MEQNLVCLSLLAAAALCGASDLSARASHGGPSISPTFGAVVAVGDSCLDGMGHTDGAFERAVSEGLDGTLVLNNAVGGADVASIAGQRACSQVSECLFSVVDGGINGGTDGFSGLVSREVQAGRRVVIVGYPEGAGPVQGPNYEALMDGHRAIAESHGDKVRFVDPRTMPEFNFSSSDSRQYRSTDNSHPSPLGGQLLGEKVAEAIRAMPSATATASTCAAGEARCADLGRFPGYNGTIEAKGAVRVGDTDNATIALTLSMSGLEPSAVGGVHVHAGTSCDVATAPGPHFFSTPEDGWKQVKYSTDAQGAAVGSVSVACGYDAEACEGRVIVVHDKAGAKVACGVIGGAKSAPAPSPTTPAPSQGGVSVSGGLAVSGADCTKADVGEALVRAMVSALATTCGTSADKVAATDASCRSSENGATLRRFSVRRRTHSHSAASGFELGIAFTVKLTAADAEAAGVTNESVVSVVRGTNDGGAGEAAFVGLVAQELQKLGVVVEAADLAVASASTSGGGDPSSSSGMLIGTGAIIGVVFVAVFAVGLCALVCAYSAAALSCSGEAEEDVDAREGRRQSLTAAYAAEEGQAGAAKTRAPQNRGPWSRSNGRRSVASFMLRMMGRRNGDSGDGAGTTPRRATEPTRPKAEAEMTPSAPPAHQQA